MRCSLFTHKAILTPSPNCIPDTNTNFISDYEHIVAHVTLPCKIPGCVMLVTLHSRINQNAHNVTLVLRHESCCYAIFTCYASRKPFYIRTVMSVLREPKSTIRIITDNCLTCDKALTKIKRHNCD